MDIAILRLATQSIELPDENPGQVAKERGDRHDQLHNDEKHERIQVDANPTDQQLFRASRREREKLEFVSGKAQSVEVHRALGISFQDNRRHQSEQHARIAQSPDGLSMFQVHPIRQPDKKEMHGLGNNHQPEIDTTRYRGAASSDKKKRDDPQAISRGTRPIKLLKFSPTCNKSKWLKEAVITRHTSPFSITEL